MKLILIGNYGVGNIGDEALREYFLQRFPQVQWTVLSASPSRPNELPRLPFGIRSFARGGWRKTLRAIRQSDAVVFGGGSLLTDVESITAPLLWGWHALVARLCRKPLILAFQGIGPFRSPLARWVSNRVIRSSTYLSLRDQESVARLPANTNSVLSFDPIITFLTKPTGVRSENVLIVIPRQNSGQALLSMVQEELKNHAFDAVSIVLMQPSMEQGIAALLQSEISLPTTIHPAETLDALCAALARGTCVISERYHGAMAAMSLGIPVNICVQKEGDKLSALKHLLESGVNVDALKERVRKGEESLRAALA